MKNLPNESSEAGEEKAHISSVFMITSLAHEAVSTV